MSGRHIVLFGTLIVVFFCQLNAAPQDRPASAQRESELIFSAKPIKPVYLKGDTIEFNFALRNASKDEQIVARSLQLTLNVGLKISDSQGKDVGWCGRIADQAIPLKSRYMTLSPGESVRAKLAISCVNKDDPTRAWGYALDAVGKYIVHAAYRLPQPSGYFEELFPNARVVRGPVSAEPVTIELR